MSTDKDVGILIGKVESLVETVKVLDSHNSRQHTSMFDYITALQTKVSGIEIEQMGAKIFGEGLSENLTLIITDIKDLKVNVSKDISELRSVMLIQLQQRIFERVSNFFVEALIPFIKTKAGFIISILITVIVIYVICGYFIGFDKILLLIDKLLKVR